MRYNHLLFALGLLNPALLVQAVSTVTVRVPTGTCAAGAYPGPSGSGSGSGSTSGSGSGSGSGGAPPTLIETVDSVYGTYSLGGCFDSGSSGFVLTGSTTTSTSMTLEYCASYCKGAAYFAVEDGNECVCGSTAPSGNPVDISVYGCATVCSGNTAECGGSPRYGIVYHCPTCSSGSGSSTVIVYSTTNSQGSTYVTSTTSALPVPSTSVVVYSTTDSKGSSYVTSTTSTLPVTSPSTSVIIYSTTNSQGSTYVTSSTSTAPFTPSTGPSVIVVTTTGTVITTDSGGSTVTSIQTKTSSSTMTTTTSIPTASANTCPGAGGIYSDALGYQYQIYCGTDFPGDDLPAVHVNTLPDCLTACDKYIPSPNVANGASCVAVSYGAGNVGGNCYLKYTITTINYGDGGIDSARMVGFNPPTPPRSESLGQDTYSGTATTPPTATTSVPPYGSTTSSTSPTTSPSTYPPAPIISSAGSTSTPNPSTARYPCPDYDGKNYIDSAGAVYGIECSTNYPGSDLSTPHYDTVEQCIAACDNYVPSPSVAGGKPCIGASWGQGNVGGNCYLKYAITNKVYGDVGVDSCFKYGYQGSSSSVSSTSISTSATSTPVGSTSGPVPGTTSSTTPAGPTTYGPGSDTMTTPAGPTTYGPGSDTSTTPATPSSYGPGSDTSTTSAAPSTYGSDTSTTPAIPSSYGPDTSTTPASPSSYGPDTSTTPAAPSTYGSGPGTSTTPTSAAPSAEATLTNPYCPANNNTRYTDVFGTTFEVKCGLQIDGNNAHPAHADTFGKCVEYCDILEGCAAVTYEDGASAQNSNCYPYSSFRFYSTQGPGGLFSGVPVNGPTTGAGVNNDLCPQYNGSTFVDRFGNTYNIGCDQNIDGGGTTGGQDLYATVANTLEGCLTYCSTYNTCVGVDWTGVETGNGANCYPKFGVGAVVYQPGTQWAALQT